MTIKIDVLRLTFKQQYLVAYFNLNTKYCLLKVAFKSAHTHSTHTVQPLFLWENSFQLNERSTYSEFWEGTKRNCKIHIVSVS